MIIEQAVYGSFPFWDRGYAVLAQSPGCRPEWLSAFAAACRGLGDRPPGPAGGLFTRPVAGGGPRMIVGVSDQGHDDRGRAGASAFHALFVRPRDYDRAGADPFPFARLHRALWSADTALDRLAADVDPPADLVEIDDRARTIARAIAGGSRVVVEADAPIDGLARSVWRALPRRARRRSTLATWAAHPADLYDLVGRPRGLGPIAVGPYVRADDLISVPGATGRPRAARSVAVLAAVGLAIGAGAAWWVVGRDRDLEDPPATVPPAATADDAAPLSAEARARVAEDLIILADRFGVEVAPGDAADPTALMARLAGRLRYRGPTLDDAERRALRSLADGGDPEARLALARDAHIAHFLPDRPLPGDFAEAPPRRQLALLAWSFRLAIEPGEPAEGLPAKLADALAVDGPARAGALAARYPALDAYARFLGRLPRR